MARLAGKTRKQDKNKKKKKKKNSGGWLLVSIYIDKPILWSAARRADKIVAVKLELPTGGGEEGVAAVGALIGMDIGLCWFSRAGDVIEVFSIRLLVVLGVSGGLLGGLLLALFEALLKDAVEEQLGMGVVQA